MNTPITLTPSQLLGFLMNVSVVRPVLILLPGHREVGTRRAHCRRSWNTVDLVGVPQIVAGESRFYPPAMIARDEPYCLFLDELDACSQEVQKAFCSLIHERRIGEYTLPNRSVVIGAGNRAQDNAIVKPMSSALVNRMIHVHLKVSHRDWLA